MIYRKAFWVFDTDDVSWMARMEIEIESEGNDKNGWNCGFRRRLTISREVASNARWLLLWWSKLDALLAVSDSVRARVRKGLWMYEVDRKHNQAIWQIRLLLDCRSQKRSWCFRCSLSIEACRVSLWRINKLQFEVQSREEYNRDEEGLLWEWHRSKTSSTCPKACWHDR